MRMFHVWPFPELARYQQKLSQTTQRARMGFLQLFTQRKKTTSSSLKLKVFSIWGGIRYQREMNLGIQQQMQLIEWPFVPPTIEWISFHLHQIMYFECVCSVHTHTAVYSCLSLSPPSRLFPLSPSDLQGSSEKRLAGNGGKLNTSQAEPVAANSWAVGQFLSISCETFLWRPL